MKKIIESILLPDFDPEVYNGFFDGLSFKRFFPLDDNSLEETFQKVNSFLEDNGYETFLFEEFNNQELIVENNNVSIYADPYCNQENRQLVCVIKIPSKNMLIVHRKNHNKAKKENFSHFGDLIHRIEHQIYNDIYNYFSSLSVPKNKEYPNQWVHLVYLIKKNLLKQYDKLYKKSIVSHIEIKLREIVLNDSIIKKLSIIYQDKDEFSDYDKIIIASKNPCTKKEFKHAVLFSHEYILNLISSDFIDIIEEFKTAISQYSIQSETQELIKKLIDFRNERDWEQFHNPKDLAIALNVEAGELLELFLWKNADEANKEKVKEELADIFAYAFLLTEKYQLDVKDIVLQKIKKNGEKYPVDKSKGNAKKYNEL